MGKGRKELWAILGYWRPIWSWNQNYHQAPYSQDFSSIKTGDDQADSGRTLGNNGKLSTRNGSKKSEVHQIGSVRSWLSTLDHVPSHAPAGWSHLSAKSAAPQGPGMEHHGTFESIDKCQTNQFYVVCYFTSSWSSHLYSVFVVPRFDPYPQVKSTPVA